MPMVLFLLFVTAGLERTTLTRASGIARMSSV